jgi:threonine/homoserine/homoserine lactone efflux protein
VQAIVSALFPWPTLSMLLLGIVAVLVTPGPTNTLLAAAGMQRGVKRASPLVAAELCGYLVSISLCGWLVAHTAARFAWLPLALRVASGVFVAMLAVRMWRASVDEEVDEAVDEAVATRSAATMKSLFVATLLNPKAMLFAGTIFPAIAFTDLGRYVQAMTVFALALVPIGVMWIAMGAALGSGRIRVLTPARVQRGAALVLSVFAVSIAMSLVR